MLTKIKNVINSIFYTRSMLKKNAVFYGSANNFLDTRYHPDSQKWKNSQYSCKLMIERLEGDLVYYYSFYIDTEGVEYIKSELKYAGVQSFINKIRTLKLIIG